MSDAERVFRRQLECVRKDDREAQLALYSENCIFEFPFATDRPRRLAGRDEFRRVMTPLWAEARRLGVVVTGCDAVVHMTTDPEVIVAEFTLTLAGAAEARIPFVQVVRVRDGRIAEIREYFSQAARSEALGRAD
ncbi:MAG TPA: nuclear transport factor 2 family protein [Kofleriaceae bacterium]|nr:nuclear transport factor 2 family protein [Kofleriaceae bacterium]